MPDLSAHNPSSGIFSVNRTLRAPLAPPSGEGNWTLLQQRIDRSLWQWDRQMPISHHGITRYVIQRDPGRFDFDDYDEAESIFGQMED